MKVERNERGFEIINERKYPVDKGVGRLLQASSIVGKYADAFERPGTSALWVGEDHHLNREQVADLVQHMQAWLETGSLALSRELGGDIEQLARASLSRPEAARLLRVSLGTVDNYIRAGRLRATKLGPWNVRIPRSDVEKLLRTAAAVGCD